MGIPPSRGKAFERFFPEHQLRYRRGSECWEVFSEQRLAARGALRFARVPEKPLH
jgi:hypothetical protein